MWNAFHKYQEMRREYCWKARFTKHFEINREVHYSFIKKATK